MEDPAKPPSDLVKKIRTEQDMSLNSALLIASKSVAKRLVRKAQSIDDLKTVLDWLIDRV
jgi:hypothetical protein